MYTKKRFVKGLAVALMLIICACGKNTLQAKLDLGNKYLEELKYEDALVSFLNAIEIDDKSVEAYVGASTAYLYLGDLESAIEILVDGQIATEDGGIVNMIATLGMVPEDATLFNGHFYKAFNRGLDWYSAEAQCVSMGGHLISINSAEEQTLLTNIITAAGKNMYWGGLYLNGSDWLWTDGSEFSYTYWAKDEPNFIDNEETTLQIYAKYYGEFSPGEWNDSAPTGGTVDFYTLSGMGFVCEWNVINP